jgi:AAA+ ATPase superfamily predicted ATPase
MLVQHNVLVASFVMLPFVDRRAELARLRRALTAKDSSLVCVYGRRRVGKSRLVAAALDGLAAVYYLADERDERLQRRSLAHEIERLVPGFARVEYPDWDALFDRWAEAAPKGAVLAIDELPYLGSAAPALPSILQRRIDRDLGRQHWVVCGSSQRMMHGIILDAAAPRYGRAREIVKVDSLPFPYLAEALRIRDAEAAVAAFATWGGVPRYWELARGAGSRELPFGEHPRRSKRARYKIADPFLRYWYRSPSTRPRSRACSPRSKRRPDRATGRGTSSSRCGYGRCAGAGEPGAHPR